MSRRVTLESAIGEIVFRLPNLKDIWAVMGQLPVLPQGEQAIAEADPEKVLGFIEKADALLIRCAKQPRLYTAEEAGEEEQDIEEIPVEERVGMFNQLLKAAGYGTEAAAERPT